MQLEPDTQSIRVGVIGYGTVGQALVEILQQLSWTTVTAVGVRSEVHSLPPGIRVFYDIEQLIRSEQVDIVVEVTNDSIASLEYLRTAFQVGKPFVTANKQLVAQSLLEIQEKRRSGQIVLYEAAVCASIPVLRTLATSWVAETCQRISGIVNGTTNFVLDAMFARGYDLNRALSEARTLGYAERDATKDLTGIDAAHKLSILMFHAFGVWIPSERIPTVGICSVSTEDTSFLKARGLRPKLIASAYTTKDGICASVVPHAVAEESPFCRVQGEINALELQWEHAASQLLQGPGAGGVATASAVIGDIAAAAQRHTTVPHTLCSTAQSMSCEVIDQAVKVLLRCDKDACASLPWQSIDEHYTHGDTSCIVGRVSLASLTELYNKHQDTSFFVLQQ